MPRPRRQAVRRRGCLRRGCLRRGCSRRGCLRCARVAVPPRPRAVAHRSPSLRHRLPPRALPRSRSSRSPRRPCLRPTLRHAACEPRASARARRHCSPWSCPSSPSPRQWRPHRRGLCPRLGCNRRGGAPLRRRRRHRRLPHCHCCWHRCLHRHRRHDHCHRRPGRRPRRGRRQDQTAQRSTPFGHRSAHAARRRSSRLEARGRAEGRRAQPHT